VVEAERTPLPAQPDHLIEFRKDRHEAVILFCGRNFVNVR
jgi:hypothetical protein